MRLRSAAGLALLLGTSVVVVRGQQATQSAENYIKLSEQQWAEVSMKRDTTTVERILADDFEWGRLRFRQKQRCERSRLWRCCRGAGSESWEKRNGERGRYAWTDTWIRRNSEWQIVAAVDVKVPEPAK